MILVDPRAGSGMADRGGDLLPYILAQKQKAEKSMLAAGDACFEGNGKEGRILIGIERKRLSDILNCVDDARYAQQRVVLKQMYRINFLIIEGVWKPDSVTGYLMECIQYLTWKPYRYRSQMVRYSKLFRYLISVQLGGTPVVITRDIEHTAYNIVEIYQYFQKRWEDHTSLIEVQKMSIPDMNSRPSLVRRWASDLDGVGVKYSLEADQLFPSAYDLATGDEFSWLKIKGIGVATAQDIIRQIWKKRR